MILNFFASYLLLSVLEIDLSGTCKQLRQYQLSARCRIDDNYLGDWEDKFQYVCMFCKTVPSIARESSSVTLILGQLSFKVSSSKSDEA